MIQITFQLADVAAAAALFAKLNGTEVAAATVTKAEAPGKSGATPAPSPRTAAPSPAEKPAAPEQSTAKQEPQTGTAMPAAAPSAPAGDAVDYPTLQKAVLALHKLDPSAAVPIAKSLGADTFKLLKPEQWADAFAKVNAAIAERTSKAA